MNEIQEVILDLDEAPVELGRAALWKAKDGDHAVTIAGDLGVGPDGRHYVSVENTSTGIPLDELEI